LSTSIAANVNELPMSGSFADGGPAALFPVLSAVPIVVPPCGVVVGLCSRQDRSALIGEREDSRAVHEGLGGSGDGLRLVDSERRQQHPDRLRHVDFGHPDRVRGDDMLNELDEVGVVGVVRFVLDDACQPVGGTGDLDLAQPSCRAGLPGSAGVGDASRSQPLTIERTGLTL